MEVGREWMCLFKGGAGPRLSWLMGRLTHASAVLLFFCVLLLPATPYAPIPRLTDPEVYTVNYRL